MKKHNTLWTLLALVLALCLMAALTGCGSSEPAAAAPKAETEAKTEEPAAAAEPELDPGKTYHTVTWHYNSEAGDEETKLEDGTRLAEPAQPEREGYVFNGWYEDAGLTKAYVFGTKIGGDVELYASWSVSFTFEAEDVSFAGKSSPVFSGAISGLGMIAPDMYGRGASNGYYVMGLYSKTDAEYDTTLEFNLVASEPIENAKLYLRLSAAYASMTVNGSNYQVVVNGTAYNYSDIVFTVPDGVDAFSAYVDFQDYLVASNVSLQEGANLIQLVVNNTDSLGGTTRATAPCVDCIRISAPNGTVSWAEGFPKTSNYSEDD